MSTSVESDTSSFERIPARLTWPATPRRLDRELIFAIFFFAAYGFLVYELIRILAPFLAPLLGAAMLAVVVYPLRQTAMRIFRQPTPAAFALTILIMVTIIVPLSLLTWLVTREAATALPTLSEWLTIQQNQGWTFVRADMPVVVDRLWTGVRHLADMVDLDFKAVIVEGVRAMANRLTSLGASAVRQFFVLAFQIVLLVFALFFFLRDGSKMTRAIADLIPMESASKTEILDGLDRTLVAMVRGTVVTALAQGTLTGVGLALFGVPFPILLGFAATFLSIVPYIGAALVWVPAAVFLVLTGHTVAAAGLALWGLIAVGLIDNLLRPLIVGGQARLPATLLFLGVIGGLQVYGVIGGLISPLLIASVLAFARIYRAKYIDAVALPLPSPPTPAGVS